MQQLRFPMFCSTRKQISCYVIQLGESSFNIIRWFVKTAISNILNQITGWLYLVFTLCFVEQELYVVSCYFNASYKERGSIFDVDWMVCTNLKYLYEENSSTFKAQEKYLILHRYVKFYILQRQRYQICKNTIKKSL